MAYDLNNLTVKDPEQFADQYGGLFRENTANAENQGMNTGFPVRFLLWEGLDTLQMSLNYLQGGLPTDDQILGYFRNHGVTESTWSASDAEVRDSIPAAGTQFFTDNEVPKELPHLNSFAINLNRFSGDLNPDTHKWLFYHPKLDRWDPYTFVFTQEGTAFDGTPARFSGVPASLDDYGSDAQGTPRTGYYELYPRKGIRSGLCAAGR